MPPTLSLGIELGAVIVRDAEGNTVGAVSVEQVRACAKLLEAIASRPPEYYSSGTVTFPAGAPSR